MKVYDSLILGAGPAGLQMGYCFQKAGLDYLILERGEVPGRFFQKFPRHRQLISINKIYTGYEDREVNLRWDWNSLLCEDDHLLFKNYSKSYLPKADAMVKYLADFSERYELAIRFNTSITQITKEDLFCLRDDQGNQFFGKRLIVATGVSKPYVPAIPGIDLVETYTDVSLDAEDFANQRVLILGKGNSGFEIAENLLSHAISVHLASPQSLRLAWQTHFVGHLRAINNNLLDTYQLKSQNAVLDADIIEIRREGDGFNVVFNYTHADGEREELYYDRVISCTGFRFDNAIFDASCRPELTINDRFPRLTDQWESTNVPHLYFVGTLTQSLDYQKTTSAFIHGFRYNVRSLFHFYHEKYHGVPWPSKTIANQPDVITEFVLNRINTTSALWQQFGFLVDLLVVDEESQTCRYYEELPANHIPNSEYGATAHYYTISLEYGPDHVCDNPFKAERIRRDDTTQADQSRFLHPVIRCFHNGTKTSEHHVIEDLQSEWREPEHYRPLEAYFAENQGHSERKQVPA